MLRTLVALLSTVVVGDCAVNYCGARMCGYSNEHTLCQYPAGPGPSCVGYAAAPLTLEEKVRILSRLNRRRSDAAAGRLRRLPTAGDMLKLPIQSIGFYDLHGKKSSWKKEYKIVTGCQLPLNMIFNRWVEELAREAQRWADQCRPPQTPDEHDSCRDLYSVSVGQSVASVVGEAPGLRVESLVDLWYMQNIHYKGNVTTYLPPMSIVNYYGDFAQIVWSYTYMVGCGRSRFMIQQQGRLRSVERLVCNFGPRGPISGQAIWIPEEPASLCPPRSVPDTEYPGLCAYQPYLTISNDTANMTSIEEDTLLNTVLEIEMNDMLKYPGSIDEIYLTKIAIATLEDKAKTESYYNTFQKRDVVDKLIINNQINNISQEPFEEKANVNVRIEGSTNLKLQNSTRIKLIGRPKSYNPDDLIDVGGVQSTENYEIPVDLPNEKREFYADYQYIEPQDSVSVSLTENVTVTFEMSSSMSVQETTVNFNIASEIAYPLSNISILNATNGFEAELGLLNTANITGSRENNNSSLVIEKEEEFLSDPETVRDLQEALSQMEQSMETSTTIAASAAPEKVKRDVRDISREVVENKVEEKRTLPPQLRDLNVTVDKAPMLNMILRYLPYLKPYKNEILGKVTNTAISLSPSCFLICYCVQVIYFLV